MRILFAHESRSGTTRDVAPAICAPCEVMGHAVSWIDASLELVDDDKDDCPGFEVLDMSLPKFAASADTEGVALLTVKLDVIGEAFFRTLGLRQTPTLALFKYGTGAARPPGFRAPGQIARAVSINL